MADSGSSNDQIKSPSSQEGFEKFAADNAGYIKKSMDDAGGAVGALVALAILWLVFKKAKAAEAAKGPGGAGKGGAGGGKPSPADENQMQKQFEGKMNDAVNARRDSIEKQLRAQNDQLPADERLTEDQIRAQAEEQAVKDSAESFNNSTKQKDGETEEAWQERRAEMDARLEKAKESEDPATKERATGIQAEVNRIRETEAKAKEGGPEQGQEHAPEETPLPPTTPDPTLELDTDPELTGQRQDDPIEQHPLLEEKPDTTDTVTPTEDGSTVANFVGDGIGTDGVSRFCDSAGHSTDDGTGEEQGFGARQVGAATGKTNGLVGQDAEHSSDQAVEHTETMGGADTAVSAQF
jgi:hypothetical protein